MRIAYTPGQERLRHELRGYFGALMTPEVRAALAGGDRADGDGDYRDGDYGDGDAYRTVVRQLGRDGWLALSWPEEYGGRGGTMLDQLIFTDEAAIARVPVPFLTINTVGPTIMRFGTNAQVRSGSAGEVLAGRIERMHRSALILTFGGGTNEIQRDIIAAAALGLPALRRS